MNRGVLVAYLIGAFFAALTVALFVWTTSTWWTEGYISVLPGGTFWNMNSIIGLEFLFLVLGTAAIMVGEFSGHGNLRAEKGGPIGLGTNKVDVTRRSYASRVLWMLVPLMSWAAIMFVPFVIISSGDPIDTPEFGSPEDMWWVIGANAFAAAGAFGAMLASFVKALFYDRAIRTGRLARTRKGQLAAPPAGSAFWRFASYQARLELVFGFIAVGTLGVMPYAMQDDGQPGIVLWVGGSAVVLAIVALVIAANSWRSGEKLTAGESMVGGIAAGTGF
ncbi:hypothetical protein ALI44B_00030 [Leifsonia sp. ALI-44-B]|uniref:hypothetical protein n=1 Tax=Leifsonia sp. ALI-44-B TaxID=1933776 RepID=UPI00097C0122|nr:hypothetical protein [Leifsonia sp. ALI-44-B]ONI65453.1 hypothetical protein ALI44B_00030 [Leifsonia sp. ALI-44-B]